MTVPGNSFFGEFNISSLRCKGREGKAKGIGTELIDNFQRIDHIPLGLAHLLAFGVPDQSMNVDIPKGDLMLPL